MTLVDGSVIPSEAAKRRSRGIAIIPVEGPSVGTTAIPHLPASGRAPAFGAALGMTATSVTQPPARAVSYQLAIVCVVAVLLGCERTPTAETPTETRSFRMGFSAIPPSPNQTTAVASLEMWRTRADAAIMHVDVQWAAMLSGISATNAARATRSSSRIQRLYRDYVVAIADVVRPLYLGLAAETNLIRAAAPRPVYDAIVRMTTDAVADLRARGVTTPVYVSVQVETAWGRLAGTNGTFVGIDQDLRDFPFIGALSLSSYPYLAGYANPEDLPDDYL